MQHLDRQGSIDAEGGDTAIEPAAPEPLETEGGSAAPRDPVDESTDSPGPSSPVPPPGAREVLRIDEGRRRSLRRWAIAAGTLTSVVVIGATLTSTPVFDVRTVLVTGANRLSEARVADLAGVDEETNVFRLDEQASALRLERDPWIADASVETSLPSTIRITIVERTPVAVTRSEEGLLMVAEDGTALAPPPEGGTFPEVIRRGPAGEPRDSIETASSAVAALDLAVRNRIRIVTVDPDGTLGFRMRDGMTVTYGTATELTAKGQALRAILRWADQQPRRVLSVDLTVPNAPTARLVGNEITPAAPGALLTSGAQASDDASETAP